MPGPGRAGTRPSRPGRTPVPAGRGGPPGLGEQVRAIQEAAAYSTRRAAGLVSELLGPGAWQEVVLTGGAACGRLWPQILADVLGYPVGTPEHTESAARGAAMLAGRAVGMLRGRPPAQPASDAPGLRPSHASQPGQSAGL